MTKLLILDQIPIQLDQTSFGGLPVKTKGSDINWPVCSSCHCEMQYLGKIKTDIGLELIFMCGQDSGICETWSTTNGANKVIIIENTKDLEKFEPHSTNNTLRKIEYGTKIIEDQFLEYFESCQQWSGRAEDILGQISGTIDWIQNEEIPDCDCCNQPMRFIAQLEEGYDLQTGMNFGCAGYAYLFDCPKGKTAKFLWQC